MRIHWKYLTVTLVIGWFLGAASGFLIMHFCHTMEMQGRSFWHRREHFYKELKLTAEQKTQVDAILKTNHQKMDQIFAETRSKADEVRNNTRDQIRQLLTPEQQSIFDKLHVKMEARFRRRFAPLYDRPPEPKS